MEVTTTLKAFLEGVLVCSEKAANIARCCRAEKDVFDLLIQEKSSDEKNSWLVQDFKTLADVLVQEAIKHDLIKQFPALEGHIFGEESNMFTNQLGESICVKVAPTMKETSDLLSQVLNGNQRVADLMAEVVFHEASGLREAMDFSSVKGDLDLTEVAIWIDPIDSTYEYINSSYEAPREGGWSIGGLHCALVLIGVYNVESGIPIMGVVNQPFNKWNDSKKRWKSRMHWGICFGDLKITSLPAGPQTGNTGIIVTSSLESSILTPRLEKVFQVVYASGAGYKALVVALGLADAYVLSRGSTFQWDTCGPQALLSALGGGIINFSKALEVENVDEDLETLQLVYKQKEENAKGIDKWQNCDGIIAYRNGNVLKDIITALKVTER